MHLGGLRYHLPRIRQLLGEKILVGHERYSGLGYHADRLAYEMNNEPYLIPVIKGALQERAGAFLDVGANCGQTLIKVLSVDPQRRYFGFEPQLECCFFIERFKNKNDLRNVVVLPVALSDSDGATQLFFDEPVDLTASLLPVQFDTIDEVRSRSTWVLARRGDAIVNELCIEDVAVIKIDVEGFELEVIQGLQNTIRKFEPVLIFEILTNRKWGVLFDSSEVRAQKQARADQIFALLKEFSYSVWRIDNKGHEHSVEKIDLDATLGPDFTNDGRDYVARHCD